MKFKIAKQDFEPVIQVASASLSGSGNDISTHFLFRVVERDGKDVVEVLTYSGRVFSLCPTKAVVEDKGTGLMAFSVEGKRLKSWLAPASGPLTFWNDDTIVTAKSDRTKNTFPSLNPATFPYWDNILADAKPTAKLKASRLAAVLNYAKLFISDAEAAHPELCVCEVRDGILYSTDKQAATLIRVAGLENAKFRIHGKDVSGVVSFLGMCKEPDEVEVLEHDKALLLRRWDGAIFGESRYQVAFPGLQIDMDVVDQREWTFAKDDIDVALQNLSSCALDTDNRLSIRFTPDAGPVTFSNRSVSGLDTDHEVGCAATAQPNAPALPASGFALDRNSLRKVLSTWEGDQMNFLVNVSGSRGFVRFVSERDGDKHLTILAWLR